MFYKNVKTAEQVAEESTTAYVKELENYIQSLHDSKAQELGYDSINSIAKYLGYENPYRAECEALGVWVAACWDKYYDLLNSDEFVTKEELLGQLPSV
jgi:site-specific recombinase XerD